MTTFADKFIPKGLPREETMTVRVQFTDYRSERKSEVLGPFSFVQITYRLLRVKAVGVEEERELAFFALAHQEWEYEGQLWSDVCIF